MRRVLLRIVASVLIIVGIFCIVVSGEAIGDIGLSIAMAGTVGILSGIGLWLVPGR